MNEHEIAKKPYRIQDSVGWEKNKNFHDNKAYASFEEAQCSAEIQSTNCRNVELNNRFIIYKAIAVVGPVKPPAQTTILDEIPI